MKNKLKNTTAFNNAEIRKRLIALFVAVVFVLGTAYVPTGVFATEEPAAEGATVEQSQGQPQIVEQTNGQTEGQTQAGEQSTTQATEASETTTPSELDPELQEKIVYAEDGDSYNMG